MRTSSRATRAHPDREPTERTLETSRFILTTRDDTEDQRGHGATATSEEELGYFADSRGGRWCSMTSTG